MFVVCVRRPPRCRQSRSSAASDVYKGQLEDGEFTVVYNESTGRLSIAMVSASYVRLLGRDPSRPNDALEVIGAGEGGINIVNGVLRTLPHHVDVVGVRVLFLASPNFGAYNCLGPRGESDYIRQIMVNEGYSGYITDKLNHPAEYIDVGGQQMQSLRFRLVDGSGAVVDLKGRSIAFSIIFLDSKKSRINWRSNIFITLRINYIAGIRNGSCL